jgi:predicted dehydrogenase
MSGIAPGIARAAANEKFHVASIGSGGMGWGDINQVASHPDVVVAAVCDVDANNLKKAMEQFNCPGFADYREMIAQMGNKIDGITVSTPDHTHAPAAMTGMNNDLHVYCQKPLTWSIHESRALSNMSKQKPDLVTQMGTQRASTEGKRQAVNELKNGIVGQVVSIYGWSDRPAGWWPQGQDRKPGSDPVPEHLDWDLWLGVAPERPYKSGSYAHFAWRGVMDFGCGAIGDMACHIVDTPFYAYDLVAPMTFRVDCDDTTADQYPSKESVMMTFPGNQFSARDTIPFTWFDGGILPAASEIGMPDGMDVPQNCCAIVGEEGTLLVGMDGDVRLFSGGKEHKFESGKLKPRNHYHHWVDGCLGRAEPEAHFEFAARLTESMLLGAVGCRYPGSTLFWDSEKMIVPNRYSAKKYIERTYRAGFEVENL